MIPYVPYPTFEIGSYTLGSFWVLVGLAILVEFRIVMTRAPRFGISPLETSTLLGWAIGLGIFGAHVFDMLVYFPDQVRRDPWELLRFWGTLSSFGGMLGGILGLLAVMQIRRVSPGDQLRFIDCLLFALPFTLAVGRLGCGLQHDHLGISSDHFLAVRFPDGPRFDLGLLEFFYATAMAALFWWLDRQPRRPGFYIGTFFALYGPVRFVLDALRTGDVRYGGWTPGQYLSIVATLAGLAVLIAVMRADDPAADEPAAT